MNDDILLSLAKNVVKAIGPLLDDAIASQKDIQTWEGREPKADIDSELSNYLMHELGPSGVPVLSEEGGHHVRWNEGTVWIIDPLDGTLNFVRGAGPSAVSVALWRDGRPIFGVLLDVTSRQISWGGRGFGAWRDDQALRVSNAHDTQRGVLCTGIPSGFDFESQDMITRWVKLISCFGKVRMIGSAASSLTLLAAGTVDCYSERNIKIWDVAAGLALVEAAGGKFVIADNGNHTLSVLAMTSGLEEPLALFKQQ